MKIGQALYKYFIPQPLQEETTNSDGFNADIKPESQTKNISMTSANNTPIYGVPSVLDSLIRGIGRYYETKIENYFSRVGFRFITEIARYGSSRSLLNFFLGKKLDLSILTTGIKKSLEITLGTAVIDPNRQSDRLKRMGSGFLNMVARLGSRAGFVALKILPKEQLSFKTLSDEFLSRTLCRVFYINSKNPLVGIACRTVEQFAINEWVRNLPVHNFVISKLFPQNSSNTSNDTETENQDLNPAVQL